MIVINKRAKKIHRHTGGLEKHYYFLKSEDFIHRHTGGLENAHRSPFDKP